MHHTVSDPDLVQCAVLVVNKPDPYSASSLTGTAEVKGQPTASQTSVSGDKGHVDEVSSQLVTKEEVRVHTNAGEFPLPRPLPPQPQPTGSPEAAPPTRGRGHRRRKLLLRGECSAVAVQLFAIDEAYEMRFVVVSLHAHTASTDSLPPLQVNRFPPSHFPTLPSELMVSQRWLYMD